MVLLHSAAYFIIADILKKFNLLPAAQYAKLSSLTEFAPELTFWRWKPLRLLKFGKLSKVHLPLVRW